jgi:hypothetical protein
MLRKLLLVPAFLAAAAPAVAQATIDPTRAIGLTPDQIVWKKGVNNDTAWPIGDPKTPGACLELIRWHPTYFSRPHYHPQARYAVVLSGTWWVSTSNVYDPDNNTVPFPAGSVITDLVGGVHYDGAKPATGDATIAIFMECPLSAVPAEKK